MDTHMETLCEGDFPSCSVNRTNVVTSECFQRNVHVLLAPAEVYTEGSTSLLSSQCQILKSEYVCKSMEGYMYIAEYGYEDATLEGTLGSIPPVMQTLNITLTDADKIAFQLKPPSRYKRYRHRPPLTLQELSFAVDRARLAENYIKAALAAAPALWALNTDHEKATVYAPEIFCNQTEPKNTSFARDLAQLSELITRFKHVPSSTPDFYRKKKSAGASGSAKTRTQKKKTEANKIPRKPKLPKSTTEQTTEQNKQNQKRRRVSKPSGIQKKAKTAVGGHGEQDCRILEKPPEDATMSSEPLWVCLCQEGHCVCL
ncbi:hypothetical protein CYMTET_55938 [Cymbomonas tetramitiformis]|uniref:Uncharacterized protein n=1 Tax=Cymbomonas tetramitiformis TaxID=36881 RepID=A0AAE0BD44_9CHLO|nr:hypothetical protein CYMTET_55938 [Cymbomonas tetramitiformis]|eukprot:gene10594-12533_t